MKHIPNIYWNQHYDTMGRLERRRISVCQAGMCTIITPICLVHRNNHAHHRWNGRNKGLRHCDMLQTTQPTSGGAVTADSSCCANCVEPPRPQQWGPDLPFFGHAGHADPLDGWRCCSQKRVMSRPIQV